MNCTCGARKVYRAADGAREHSDWCDVSALSLKNGPPKSFPTFPTGNLTMLMGPPVIGKAAVTSIPITVAINGVPTTLGFSLPYPKKTRPGCARCFTCGSTAICWESVSGPTGSKLWCNECLLKATGGYLGQRAHNTVGSLTFLHQSGYPSDEPTQYIGTYCQNYMASGRCKNIAELSGQGVNRCFACVKAVGGTGKGYHWLDMNTPHPAYAATASNPNRILGQGPIMDCMGPVAGGCYSQTGKYAKGQINKAIAYGGAWYGCCGMCENAAIKNGTKVVDLLTLPNGTKIH